MKLVTAFIVGIFTFLTFQVEGQVDTLECERWKFHAGKAINNNDFKRASSYLIKAKIPCGLDDSYWERLIGCLKAVVNEESDSEKKQRYIDTLLNAWDEQEQLGLYQQHDDFDRATWYAQSLPPEFEKADSLFQKRIKTNSPHTHEFYIVSAYYVTYKLFTESEGAMKSNYKTRLLFDYLNYKEFLKNDSIDWSRHAEESLDTYIKYVYPDCESLLPEVDKFLQSIPEDSVLALQRIEQLEHLLRDKDCDRDTVYSKLIDKWLELDSNSLTARYIKDRNSKTASDRVGELIEKTDDPELKAELLYKKAYLQYKAGQYMNAYSTGKACTGKYRHDGLLIAAQSVAALANTCGETTFERKCNYLYAAQLAEEAGSDEIAGRYRASAPSVNCTTELVPVTLSCWGVVVCVCQ